MSGENFDNESTIFCDPKVQKNNPAPSFERRPVDCFPVSKIVDNRLASDLTVDELRRLIRKASFHPWRF